MAILVNRKFREKFTKTAPRHIKYKRLFIASLIINFILLIASFNN